MLGFDYSNCWGKTKVVRMTRLYVPIPLAAQQEVVLQDAIVHRLQHVLRCGLGDVVHLFNGEVFQDFPATITAMDRRHIVVQTHEGVAQRSCAGPRRHLCQAMIKPKSMDWLVQKATELGVDEITPLYTDYTQAKKDVRRDEKNLAHWYAIAIAAAEQCGRGGLPVIHAPAAFGDSLADLNERALHLVGAMQPPYVGVDAIKQRSDVTIFIGPEGGFSESEYQRLYDHHAHAISLGPLILRAETAAMAALLLCQQG